MPTIFSGVKKKNVQVVGPSDEGDDMDVLKALADSILNAVQSRDASALSQALKSFHLECEDYDKDEE